MSPQGPWQGVGGCSGDAGGDAMDLTRRQREQRKKDIRSKVGGGWWVGDNSINIQIKMQHNVS